MKIQQWKIERVRPYEQNPRDNRAAVEAVAESIRRFGFRQPIVVDRDGVVIAGHTRLLAAQSLGMTTVPVHVALDMDEAQVRAYRLADNKTGEIATWDKALLAVELKALEGSGLDFTLLGFEAVDLEQLLRPDGRAGLTDPDAVPAVPAKAKTQPGDLWVLGEHRLLCGDSGSTEAVDRLLAGAPVHLVHADPPYNVAVEPRSNNAIASGRSSFPGTGGKTTELRAKDRPIENDQMSREAFDQKLRDWFGQMARVLVPGRSFYLWGGYGTCEAYQAAMRDCSLYFSQAIIWVKESPVMNRKDFMGNHEWCSYGWREGAAHEFFGGHNIQDVWELSRAQNGALAIGRGIEIEAQDGTRLSVMPPDPKLKVRKVALTTDNVTLYGASETTDVWRVKKVPNQKAVHLTEKPVELARRAMRLSSRPGENVLDLFGGSGSTLIAAHQTDRRAFLMELDPLYCDVIVRRWEEFTGQKARLDRPQVGSGKKATKPGEAKARTKQATPAGRKSRKKAKAAA